MPQDFFEFKQFTVKQQFAAMKVSTDACIQGALAAKFWEQEQKTKVLDIGTGTGLLTLMLAQSLPEANFTAIDIDQGATKQASQNASESPYFDRIKVIQQDLDSIERANTYDGIICNPPFFHNHLKGNDVSRKIARHDESLSKSLLAQKVSDLLTENGSFCILYPTNEWSAWEEAAASEGLHCIQQVLVHPHPQKTANRVIGFYQKQKLDTTETGRLDIYAAPGGAYTAEFVDLLKPYYLHL